MAETNCRRELDLEFPRKMCRKPSAVARSSRAWRSVPGFRPGKAPVPLIRRRFADDIKGEVLQSLVPDQIQGR